MATRQLLTVDAVINCVVSDDEDYDDPDEPMMEGSDDFSDLQLDDNMDDGDTLEQICPSCSASIILLYYYYYYYIIILLYYYIYKMFFRKCRFVS